ncbi:hypothetical protein PV04_09109 [Phialophora macrospora]|uniref:Oxidase FUB9 n=1 Tax=Phialophora macrospora TaxID=1851006 RepID=A0A0D2FBD4_9EURO|nr:hypothetical protein PV04_09109 [Phialophora macrospora]
MSLDDILTIKDLQASAATRLPQAVQEFYDHGAMDMITLRDNEAAYDRYKIIPRVLRNVADLDVSVELFGTRVAAPLGISPSAMHCLAHPDGEKATSAAAAAYNIPMALSLWATTSLEDVAARGNGNPYIMQLTLFQDRTSALAVIKRAERAGYQALFVTVDTPTLGRRLTEMRHGVRLPEHMSFPNMMPQADSRTYKEADSDPRSFYHASRDPSNSWESVIPWLKSNTTMDIWLKGVYHPEDALLAAEHGLAGILVSNHGGRQLDGVPATLDLLPAIAQAVRGRIPIAVDGGIRRGSDMFKALALGADFCFVARPILWGLAHSGEDGAKRAIEILLHEFKATMMLAGCAKVSDVNKAYLVRCGNKGLSNL